jgi:chemotaxis protein methyltransferase CheR
LTYLRDLIRRRSAIVIEADKNYLVDARLAPLAKSEGFKDIDEMLVVVRRTETSPLTRKVIEAMTTNETSFFRDIHPWDALRLHMLPELIKKRQAAKRLRIWCAAASTGQEPWTIAMVIREHFPELDSWNVQIIGTDLNATVLEKARSGVYKQMEVNRGLPAPMLVKYFERSGTEWKVKDSLRQLVVYQELNLLERWTLFSVHDIVFMRNVLIYFDTPTKKDILARVREKLSPDGYLVLGGAETTLNLDEQYAAVRAGPTVVYQAKSGSGTTNDQRRVANDAR